jgi:hypothetical protein
MFNPSFQTMVVEVSRHPWSTAEFRVDYRVYRQQRKQTRLQAILPIVSLHRDTATDGSIHYPIQTVTNQSSLL